MKNRDANAESVITPDTPASDAPAKVLKTIMDQVNQWCSSEEYVDTVADLFKREIGPCRFAQKREVRPVTSASKRTHEFKIDGVAYAGSFDLGPDPGLFDHHIEPISDSHYKSQMIFNAFGGESGSPPDQASLKSNGGFDLFTNTFEASHRSTIELINRISTVCSGVNPTGRKNMVPITILMPFSSAFNPDGKLTSSSWSHHQIDLTESNATSAILRLFIALSLLNTDVKKIKLSPNLASRGNLFSHLFREVFDTISASPLIQQAKLCSICEAKATEKPKSTKSHVETSFYVWLQDNLRADSKLQNGTPSHWNYKLLTERGGEGEPIEKVDHIMRSFQCVNFERGTPGDEASKRDANAVRQPLSFLFGVTSGVACTLYIPLVDGATVITPRLLVPKGFSVTLGQIKQMQQLLDGAQSTRPEKSEKHTKKLAKKLDDPKACGGYYVAYAILAQFAEQFSHNDFKSLKWYQNNEKFAGLVQYFDPEFKFDLS